MAKSVLQEEIRCVTFYAFKKYDVQAAVKIIASSYGKPNTQKKIHP